MSSRATSRESSGNANKGRKGPLHPHVVAKYLGLANGPPTHQASSRLQLGHSCPLVCKARTADLISDLGRWFNQQTQRIFGSIPEMWLVYTSMLKQKNIHFLFDLRRRVLRVYLDVDDLKPHGLTAQKQQLHWFQLRRKNHLSPNLLKDLQSSFLLILFLLVMSDFLQPWPRNHI